MQPVKCIFSTKYLTSKDHFVMPEAGNVEQELIKVQSTKMRSFFPQNVKEMYSISLWTYHSSSTIVIGRSERKGSIHTTKEKTFILFQTHKL